MKLFESVKAAVTLRRAAETYGLRVLRNGMTCCPFQALRKILCKRYSTNVKNGAVFCALAGLNSLGFLSPGLALQYARPQGVNAARA